MKTYTYVIHEYQVAFVSLEAAIKWLFVNYRISHCRAEIEFTGDESARAAFEMFDVNSQQQWTFVSSDGDEFVVEKLEMQHLTDVQSAKFEPVVKWPERDITVLYWSTFRGAWVEEGGPLSINHHAEMTMSVPPTDPNFELRKDDCLIDTGSLLELAERHRLELRSNCV